MEQRNIINLFTQNKMSVGIIITISIIILLSIGMVYISSVDETQEEYCEFEGGDGSEENPYQISNVEQLQCINEDLEAHYELVNNIDASETKEWNEENKFIEKISTDTTLENTYTLAYDNIIEEKTTFKDNNSEEIDTNKIQFTNPKTGEFEVTDKINSSLYVNYTTENNHTQGFKPITNKSETDIITNVTDSEQLFTGVLNGNNYNITNLHITRNEEYDVGLFNVIDEKGIVKDVNINKSKIEGNRNVGLVSGINIGTISNVNINGNITGEYTVGGLTGSNNGEIIKSSTTGNIQNSGLTGSNNGEIIKSSSYANVTGNNYVGGLTEINSGNITKSYFNGTVTGNNYVGGLIGVMLDTQSQHINQTYVTGNITGENTVGGLIGSSSDLNDDIHITNSYINANITGENSIGGIIGYNPRANIKNVYSTSNITGESNIGGIVGLNDFGTVENSYWNTDKLNIEESNNGVELTTSEMQGEDNELDGFNVEETWVTVEDEYPRLHWE